MVTLSLSSKLFNRAGRIRIHETTSSLLNLFFLNLIFFVPPSTLPSGFLIDIVGRLPLLIASTVFMSLALAGFGSYAYYMSQTQNLGYAPDSAVVGQHDWIPLLCVLVFTTALALGISPISWLLIGELFPLEYRGLGSSISTSFSYFCAFVGIKLFMDFQQVRRGAGR